MIRIESMGAAWATVLPLLALLAWVGPALAARMRQAAVGARVGLAFLWLAGAAGLLAFPHDDVFAGLDVAAYRKMAHVLAAGRELRGIDPVWAQVPSELRPWFRYRPGTRPTRDLAFQLSGPASAETRPFFMPTMSLAAAGLAPGMSPDRFVPLVGALAWALVLAAAFCAGGGWGLPVAAALALGTAWPAWFLRGFYAESVGAALVAGVVATAAMRPLRGLWAGIAGFALGWSVGFHPTLIVLAVPAALDLMLERNERKTAVATAVGLLAGLFPFWAMTRWVCQPYGDWTRWFVLKQLAFSSPELRAVALALLALAVLAGVGLWAGFRPAWRARIRRLDERWTPWGWRTLCAAPLILAAACPGAVGAALRSGAAATWSGIRWPCGLLLLAGAIAIALPRRPIRERFWLAALTAAALLFWFIKGVETPVGLWSQRRFLPVILPGIALLAAPLAAGAACWARRGRFQGGLLVALLAAAGAANAIRWPAPYFTVSERGATAWTADVAERLGTNRWVVFDYYPHSVPYAAGLRQRALGLGEAAAAHWPDVARWLAASARTAEVWVATSHAPCALEDGVRLEPAFAASGAFPVVKTKAFFPAERGEKAVANAFLRWVPLAPGEAVFQTKELDGGPLALRGPWGQTRNGATWTRQGSGIVGPIPAPGGAVTLEAVAAWPAPNLDWSRQTLRVAPPWGGEPLRLEVPAGEHVVRGALARPADDAPRPATGIYEFRAERPYDPAEFGLSGYAPDLGALLRRVIIRVEPGGASVPD